MGISLSRVRNLEIKEVIRDTTIDGPVPELAKEVQKLHIEYY